MGTEPTQPIFDRPQKLVLEHVQQRTLSGNITSRRLVSVEGFDLQATALESLDYRELLQELNAGRYVFVFPSYEFDPEGEGDAGRRLRVVRYLAARTEPQELLHAIYKELMQASANTLMLWFDDISDADEYLRKILENEDGSANPLRFDAKGLMRYLSAHASSKSLSPPDWMCRDFMLGVRDEMMAKSAALELPGGAFLPVNDRWIVPYFQVCANFLRKNADSMIRLAPRIKPGLESLNRAEAEYARKPYAGPVLDFDIRRAKLWQDVSKNESTGAEANLLSRLNLAVQILSAFAERAVERQKKEWREYSAGFVGRFLEGLKSPEAFQGDWRRAVRFVNPEERRKIHPAVWPLLRNHPGLMDRRWETSDGTLFVFLADDPGSLRFLVGSLADDGSAPGWKVYVIFQLLENSEHLELLREHPSFVRDFARLRRRAMAAYVSGPWRLLLLIPLQFLRGFLSAMAQNRVTLEQKKLKKQNQEAQWSRSVGRSGEGREALIRQTLQHLDREYFQRGRIPSVRSVMEALPGLPELNDIPLDRYIHLLKQHKFVLVPVEGPDGIRRAPEAVLMFPNDASYPIYAGRVRALVEKILKSESLHGTDGGAGGGLRRARALEAHLGRPAQEVAAS